MVRLSELIRMLEEAKGFYGDIPVYWGVDGLPCWIAKKDATINDVPMRIDHVMRDINEPYLYFGDYDDIEKVRELERIMYSPSSVKRLRKIFRIE